ncbi:TIM barrel protein [Methanococcoides methylutens]|uniref:TIM barrel protein n=1 Tax=Methanococcoides methylutens TaxID=2226 RepID=UPI0040441677
MQKAADLIKQDIFQYVELTPIPNTDITPFLSYELPYVIHITTERHGFNIADKQKEDFNLKIIDDCVQWADQLDAKYLILHPGFGLIDDAMDFLDLIEDDRILIENMPKVGINGENMVGYSIEQIERLMGSRFGLCLDFGHAAKAAVSLGLDYKEHILNFVDLNPKMFHISDGLLDSEKDQHLAVGKGDYDMAFIKKCVYRNQYQYATMETPRTNMDSLSEDMENFQMFSSC